MSSERAAQRALAAGQRLQEAARRWQLNAPQLGADVAFQIAWVIWRAAPSEATLTALQRVCDEQELDHQVWETAWQVSVGR